MKSDLSNDPVFSPFPLSAEAVYELLHFSHSGTNLLRTQILDLPPTPMPSYLPLMQHKTCEIRMLPTNRRYKAEVVKAIEEMTVSGEEA